MQKNSKDFEEMQWFEDVMFYGVKDNSYDEKDEDTNFIPRLVEKALLPKLTGSFVRFKTWFCIGLRLVWVSFGLG